METGISIKGFFRVHITEDKKGKEKLVGDSGWCKNVLTNLGIQHYLGELLSASAGSLQIKSVGLGTGGSPATDAVTLPGEIMASTQRTSLTISFLSRTTSDGSATLRFTATFASSDSFITASANVSNIGLFNSSAVGNTIFAGNTYASSALNTNQNVNVTYEIQMG